MNTINILIIFSITFLVITVFFDHKRIPMINFNNFFFRNLYWIIVTSIIIIYLLAIINYDFLKDETYKKNYKLFKVIEGKRNRKNKNKNKKIVIPPVSGVSRDDPVNSVITESAQNLTIANENSRYDKLVGK